MAEVVITRFAFGAYVGFWSWLFGRRAESTPAIATPRRQRAAVALVEDGRLLLIHRVRNGKEYYVLPGGNIRASESPAMAGVREAREETGLNVWLGEKLCTLKSPQRIDHVFVVRKHRGRLHFGGPELAKMGPDNQYHLVWLDGVALGKVKMKPKELKQHCLALLGVSLSESVDVDNMMD